MRTETYIFQEIINELHKETGSPTLEDLKRNVERRLLYKRSLQRMLRRRKRRNQ